MHAAIRPYATAGVALVGAGVIAVTPVAPPLPDVHILTLHAEVALTQSANPITTLEDVITETATNLGLLAQSFAANPTPILTQISSNQAANAATLSTALQSAGNDLASNLNSIPGTLQQVATEEITQGDITSPTR